MSYTWNHKKLAYNVPTSVSTRIEENTYRYSGFIGGAFFTINRLGGFSFSSDSSNTTLTRSERMTLVNHIAHGIRNRSGNYTWSEALTIAHTEVKKAIIKLNKPAKPVRPVAKVSLFKF